MVHLPQSVFFSHIGVNFVAPPGSHRSESICSCAGAKSKIFEISSAVKEHVAACAHAIPPLSVAHLAQLRKQFADAIPDKGFSIAAL